MKEDTRNKKAFFIHGLEGYVIKMISLPNIQIQYNCCKINHDIFEDRQNAFEME